MVLFGARARRALNCVLESEGETARGGEAAAFESAAILRISIVCLAAGQLGVVSSGESVFLD